MTPHRPLTQKRRSRTASSLSLRGPRRLILTTPDGEVNFDLEAAQDEDLFRTELEEPWLQDPDSAPEHYNQREQHWASPLCPRCQQAEETTYHQLWACPANAAIEGVHADLAVRAEAEWQDAPCFWLRGLPPRNWTAAHCTLPTQGERTCRSPCRAQSSSPPTAREALSAASPGCGAAGGHLSP